MMRSLPTLADLQASPRAAPKSAERTKKQAKAKKDRAAAKVETAVRKACVERDGFCRTWPFKYGVEDIGWERTGTCHGESEWAHMHAKRRSKTRGQAPEVRHTTADSLMLCTRHHDAYDGRARPRLVIEALTDKGADGPLKFSYRGRVYTEP